MLLGFVVIILLAFWLRVYDLNTLAPGIHYDEARNIVRAWRVSHGYGTGWLLDDIPEPFDMLGRGIFFVFVGASLFAARLYTVFLHVIAVAGTIGATRALFWQHRQRDAMALAAGLTLATIPSATIFARTALRTNAVPTMMMIALMMLVWAWRTKKTGYYGLAGIFTALSAMFYLSGLIYPPIILFLLILTFVIHRQTWPGLRKLAVMGIAGFITFLPWLYLFIRIPGWLTNRAGPSEYAAVQDDPTLIFRNLRIILELIYMPFPGYPPVGYHFAPRYNAFQSAFLNIPLQMLLVAGVIYCLWNWRKMGGLAPLVMGVGIILPAAITADPRITSRMVPWFPALALLVGAGVGLIFSALSTLETLFKQAGSQLQNLRRLAWMALAALCIFSAIDTYRSVTYHFHDEPTLFEHPTDTYGIDWNYHIRLREMMAYLAEADQPIYFPHNLLNYPISVAFSRLIDFPTVHGYDGRILPTGEIIVPADLTYSSPDINRPTSYVLVLPDTGEMILLPPFKTFAELQALETHVTETGEPILDDSGWLLGHRLPISASNNPFSTLQSLPPANIEPLAVFENNLELVDLAAPDHIIPGEWVQVTLYWRLRERTRTDYFTYLQVVENDVNRRGGQDDYFSGIHRWLFPTVMWPPGEIIPDVRWVFVFPDVPTGGYRFAIQVHKYPGPEKVSFTNRYGAKEQDGSLIAGQTWVQSIPLPEPDEQAVAMDAVFGDTLQLTHATIEPPLASLQPGASVTVTLFWQALSPTALDYTLFLHVFDAGGNFVTQQDTALYEQRFPTSTWYAGAKVVTTHTLQIPENAVAPYHIDIGWYLWPSLQPLSVMQEGKAIPENVIILKPGWQFIGG